ncbi:hypothetical protein AWT69_004785 [Pseudomonas putida]|nr:hypothetical protein AWT69_004785 [Pseudomonas putida]
MITGNGQAKCHHASLHIYETLTHPFEWIREPNPAFRLNPCKYWASHRNSLPGKVVLNPIGKAL